MIERSGSTKEPSRITHHASPSLGTLLDYLPANTLVLVCEPAQVGARAEEYAGQVPQDDPFFIPWTEFQDQAARRGMTLLNVCYRTALARRFISCADMRAPHTLQ